MQYNSQTAKKFFFIYHHIKKKDRSEEATSLNLNYPDSSELFFQTMISIFLSINASVALLC